MDKSNGPLPLNCYKNLQDKLYEKRKNGALEIDKFVREMVAEEKFKEIDVLVDFFIKDFFESSNANCRKGGLIGLAATAIALGKNATNYIDKMLPPVVQTLSDTDHRVRYYACESMYNIVKVMRAAVLPYFNEIFEALNKCASDPEKSVCQGSELLDRLMKDIVSETDSFDLQKFMPLLRNKIYAKNPRARQFVVSWVQSLAAVPDISLLQYLPEIIDGLFHIAADNSKEIKTLTESLLADFLKEMASTEVKVDYAAMINIVNMHCQLGASCGNFHVQLLAILWLHTFIALSGKEMLPFAAGLLASILPWLHLSSSLRQTAEEVIERAQTPDISVALNSAALAMHASALSEEVQKRTIGDTAYLIDEALSYLIKTQGDECLEPLPVEKEPDAEQAGDNSEISTTPDLHMAATVEVLCRHVVFEQPETRLAALRWLRLLLNRRPSDAFRHIPELFPLLLKCLSDPEDEVVLNVLQIMAECSQFPKGSELMQQHLPNSFLNRPDGLDELVDSSKESPLCLRFLIDLLNLFSTDAELLEKRAPLIICRLATLLSPEELYQKLAAILQLEKDAHFAFLMVKSLNSILLTTGELFSLRKSLRNYKSSDENKSLFQCLYPAWCRNAVATVSLCLLTGNYGHAAALVTEFGQVDVTEELLMEIDRLIRLIESPIFTYLRLELLQPCPELLRCLYGLLMCLPQSDAFDTLLKRLTCVPSGDVRGSDQPLDYQPLLDQFRSVQLQDAESELVKREKSIQRRL